jgi:hypothetical protein
MCEFLPESRIPSRDRLDAMVYADRELLIGRAAPPSTRPPAEPALRALTLM